MSNENTIGAEENAAGREASELSAALCPTYSVYEDESGCYHIIDGETRIVLSDSFAYDLNDDDRLTRMEAIVTKLNGP